MLLRPIITNFTAGEVSPKMLGRVDFNKYGNACKLLENFMVWPQGMASFRPGTRFIAEVKTNSKKTRIIPFEFSTTQTYIIEAGDQYMRFYMNQGQIMSGGPYEISTPYLEADLWKMKFSQSADVLYISCDGYVPYKLSRTGHTSWTLTAITFIDGPYLVEDPDLNIGMKPAAKTGNGVTLNVKALGAEKVQNGDFGYTPDVYWTVGSQWAATGHYCNHIPSGSSSGASVTQDISVVSGHTYVLSFQLGGCTVSALTVTCGGQTLLNSTQSNGYHVVEFTASSNAVLSFSADTNSMTGWFTNVSCREITGNGTFFDSGHVGAFIRLKHHGKWGYGKIVSVSNAYTATVDIKRDFGDTACTQWWREGAWSTYRGFPRLVNFFEDRLYWASNSYRPQTVWGSKVADYENHSPDETVEGTDTTASAGRIVTDACGVSYTINADQVNVFKWLKPGTALLAGTARGQWKLAGTSGNDYISPSSISAKRQTNLTSSDVAISCDHTVVFWQAFGRRLMELEYQMAVDSFVATDLSMLSDHIGRSPCVEMCYLQEPLSAILGVRADGQAFMCTYERAHQVIGWTRFVTDGQFEAIATIAGATRSEIWAVVKRTINGTTKRYVELLEDLENFEQASMSDLFYVDCGLTYSGAPTTTLSGLGHLEAKTVSVVGDGLVQASKVVSSGVISGLTQASKFQVGLPYVGTVTPVETELAIGGGTGQSRVKRIAQMSIRLYKTYGGKHGRDTSHLDTIPFDSGQMFTGDKRVIFNGDFDRNVTLTVRQDQPYPFNILAIMPIMAQEG